MNVRAKKRIGVLLALVAVVVLVGAGAYVVREQRRAARMITSRTEGLAAYAVQDWDLTLDRLGYCVSKRLRDAPVFAAFADARRRVRNDDGSHIRKALSALRTAIDIDPANRQALSLLMELYANVGYFTELSATIETVLQLDPNDRDALEYAVGVHREQDHSEQAMVAAERLAIAYPDDYPAQVIRIAAMLENQESANDVDARLDDLERVFPDKIAARVMRAMVLMDRGEPLNAVQIIRDAESSEFSDWADLEQFVHAADALSSEDSELASIADKVLKKYVEDPDIGPDAARLTLARGFRWGRFDEMDRCLEVIASTESETLDVTLGWAAFVQVIDSERGDNSFVNQLVDRESTSAKWWSVACFLVQAIEAKEMGNARELLRQLNELKADAEEHDPALALYLTALVEIESGEWRTAMTGLTDLGQVFSWRVARHTMARVFLERGYPADAYAVLRWYPGSDGILVAESLIQRGAANRGDTQLTQDLVALADDLEAEGANEPRLFLLAARARLAVGQSAEAQRLASLAFDSPIPLTTKQVLPLATHLAQTDPAAAKVLLERISVEDANTYAALWNPARSTEAQEKVLIETLSDQLAASAGDSKLKIQGQLIDIHIRQGNTAEAVTMMQQISDERPGNAQVQLQILESPAAWTDEDLIASAIEYLRVSSGTEATQWQIFALMRAIEFNHDENTISAATRSLADAIRGKPDDPQALVVLANALVVHGDPDGAATYLSRAAAADARRPIYLVQLIRVLLQAGNVAEADRRLTDLANVSVLPDDVRRARVDLLAKRGRQSDAIADLEILRSKNNPADLHRLGFMLVRQGELVRAETVFNELLELDGVSDAAIMTVADFVSIRSRDLAQGEAVLARLRDRGTAEVAVLQAAFYERHGQLDKADRFFAEALQSKPSVASPAYAIFMLRQGRFAEAKRLCDENATLIEDADDRLRVAQVLNAIGQIATICEALGPKAEEVDAIVGALSDDSSAATLLQLADALEELSRTRLTEQPDYVRFIGQLASINETEPSFYAAWRLRVWAETAQAELSQTSSTTALTTARLAARIMRDDPRTAGLVVGVLMKLENWNEAMFAAREWRDRSLADPFDAEFTIAAIYIIQREFSLAYQVVEPWWDRDPRDARITGARLVVIASALVGSGRFDEAHEILWQPENPDSTWAIQYLQLAELFGSQPAEARTWIGRAEGFLVSRNEGSLEVANSWYTLAAQTGEDADWTHVVDVLSQAKIEGETASFMLASAHDNLGQHEAAERAYRRGLRDKPDALYALNNLAYLLSQKPGGEKEAVDLSERSLRFATEKAVDPSDYSTFVDTLGICYYQAGRFEDARDQFSASIELNRTKGGAYVGLAESLFRLGDGAEASRQLAALDASTAATASLSEVERQRLAALRSELANGSGLN